MKARVLIIEDDTTLRVTLQRFLARSGHEVQVAADGESGVRLALQAPADVVLVDLNLPGMSGLAVIGQLRAAGDDSVPVVMTAYPEVRTAVAALKAGAYDYINKPFDLADLAGLVERAVEVKHLRHEVAWRRMHDDVQRDEPLIGTSPAFQTIVAQAARLAQAPGAPVLITGESGSGKEHMARAVHRLSARRSGPWVTLDCAASGAEHFEELLFGTETGSASGQRGLIELAEGGTLLLDEIGELAFPLQAKLLRVIERQVFRRPGSVRDQAANVRFLAVTHRDLEQEVAAGRFRQDLLFRLAVGRLEIPPLRSRAQDVTPLVHHFLDVIGKRLRRPAVQVSTALLRRLEAYGWPGNVRELRNIVERLLILSDAHSIAPDALPPEFARAAPERASAADEASLSLNEVELRHIQRVLARCHGNKTRAAEMLGISRLTLRQRLKDAGVADDR